MEIEQGNMEAHSSEILVGKCETENNSFLEDNRPNLAESKANSRGTWWLSKENDAIPGKRVSHPAHLWEVLPESVADTCRGKKPSGRTLFERLFQARKGNRHDPWRWLGARERHCLVLKLVIKLIERFNQMI